MPVPSRLPKPARKQLRTLKTFDAERAQFMPIREVIETFGVTRTRVFALLQAKKIQGRKLGRLIVIDVASMRDFMDRLPRA